VSDLKVSRSSLAWIPVDPIDAASSWRRASIAAAALTTYGAANDGPARDLYIKVCAESLLRVVLRVGWLGRNVLGRPVDLDDVAAWLPAMSSRVPHSAVMLLGDVTRSADRADRVAGVVALRELAAAPGRLPGRQCGFAAMVAGRALTQVSPPGLVDGLWFRAGFAAIALEGRRSSAFRFVRGDRSAPDGGLSVERPHYDT